MAKYDLVYEQTKLMKPEDTIKQFKLTEKEIEIMKYLYKQQYPKENIIENFYYAWDRWDRGEYHHMTKTEISKILGSLKKKGLIYSVIDLNGWLGTDIKI